MDRTSKEFKKLQSTWYKKLKQEGFDDIEKLDHIVFQSEAVKVFHNSGESHTRMQEKADYYRLAGHFLHDYEFKDQTERDIWFYHTEGKTIRQTVSLVKVVTRDKVFRILRELKKIMLASYT